MFGRRPAASFAPGDAGGAHEFAPDASRPAHRARARPAGRRSPASRQAAIGPHRVTTASTASIAMTATTARPRKTTTRR